MVGLRLEDNGWALEVARVPEGAKLILRGTYGEQVGGGVLFPMDGVGDRILMNIPVNCGDIRLMPSDLDWAVEIRTEGGHLIGLVPRRQLGEVLAA